MTPITLKKSKGLPIRKKDCALIFGIAISGAVIAPVLYFIGLEQTTASNAAVLSTGEMVFTVLLALLFFHEKIRVIGYMGIILIILAVVILTTKLQFLHLAPQIHFGDLMVISSMLFWALDNNISKIVSHRVDIAKIVQLKSLIGGSLLMILLVMLRIQININLVQIPNIVILGVGGFAASIFFFLHSLRTIGTVKTIIIFSTSSIFGVIFAMLFLHEQIGSYQIAAVPLMLFGIYFVIRKENN